MLFITWTLCYICLFKIIRLEGGVKSIKHFKGGASYKSFGTSVITVAMLMLWRDFWALWDNIYDCVFNALDFHVILTGNLHADRNKQLDGMYINLHFNAL
jgi:hypothetical protein